MLQLIETHDIAVPAALASLPSLKYCYLSLLIGSGAAPAPPPLPAGPRLANLRWLHYDASGLVSSTAVLHAATALEFLEAGYSSRVDWGSPAAATFFDWLASHPPLRRVSFDLHFDHFGSYIVLAAHRERLLRRRPGLEVRCGVLSNDDNYIMLDLMRDM